MTAKDFNCKYFEINLEILTLSLNSQMWDIILSADNNRPKNQTVFRMSFLFQRSLFFGGGGGRGEVHT